MKNSDRNCYFISRHISYDEGDEILHKDHIVEITQGGVDFTDPKTMIVPRWKNLGEAEDHSDPRYAVASAIRVAKAWEISSRVSTSLRYRPINSNPLFLSREELEQLADREYQVMDKCDLCFSVLGNIIYYNAEGRGQYCSTECAELSFKTEALKRVIG